MTGWDFDFDADESFAAGFNDTDQVSYRDPALMTASMFRNSKIFSQTQFSVMPVQQMPISKTTQDSIELSQENNRLKIYSCTLQRKVAELESRNQSLKTQLDDCRNWLRDAMFGGITNRK